MHVYILNIIFSNQKNLKNSTNSKKQTGIHFKNLYPLILQDRFLNINSKSGAYSAIERMKKDGLIAITRIIKIPPEIIISLKKKGSDELKEFLNILAISESRPNSLTKEPQKQPQEKSEIKSLKQTLEKSQNQVKSLNHSIEKYKSKDQSLSKTLKESQDQVQSLKQSLEKSQSQKILPKKTNTEKKMAVLDDSEYNERALQIKEKIINVLNIDEENFSKDQLEIIEETAEEILDYARK